nr:anti-sigma F factor [uncultured Blautia sp.]
MEQKNQMILEVESRSCNEGLARIAVAAFSTQLNPTLEEVADIKTAVSEAITNCIVHAYEKETEMIRIRCSSRGRELTVVIEDTGKGIENVEKAMEPLFTTLPEQDRSGMGFAFMEAFMDQVCVESWPGKGTTVTMKKVIGRQNAVFE